MGDRLPEHLPHNLAGRIDSGSAPTTRLQRLLLVAILALFAIFSITGLSWGLPSRRIDKYLFGDDPPWPGEKIFRLAGAASKLSSPTAADVDVDPLGRSSAEPIPLTADPTDVAAIYLRYRLYTHQPDEMITMMALAGMRPSDFQLDPKLYQYGGLFIYPVGALIRVCGLLGLIDVRSDIVYYLDHPDEFGKFYVVARAYAAGWGLLGVVVVFAIGQRLKNTHAGLLAALLFTVLPVVVCMAHEGKPHLPGAVLMLSAVWFGTRHRVGEVDAKAVRRDWRSMCICCGAAVGMVLSSLPVLALIPLVAWLDQQRDAVRPRRFARWIATTLRGLTAAAIIYAISNPYLLINAVADRDVLRSNFGNSLAMYEVSRIGEGFQRMIELVIEGATLPVLVFGGAAFTLASIRREWPILPLAVCAAIFAVQFALLGAGKPAEYGRFGVFPVTALAIAAAGLLARPWTRLRAVANWVPVTLVVGWVGLGGGLYLWNFHVDSTDRNSRRREADVLAQLRRADAGAPRRIALLAEPAPYGCPPLKFDAIDVCLLPMHSAMPEEPPSPPETVLIHPVDHDRTAPSVPFIGHGETPISWANKPFNTVQSWTMNPQPP